MSSSLQSTNVGGASLPFSPPSSVDGKAAHSTSPDGSPSSSAPIQFESLSREYQNITMQDSFDGFRLEAGKAVNKFLQTSHSLFLGTQLKEGGCMYQFGPTFGVDDGSLLLMARAGLDGCVNARLVNRIGKGVEVKCNMNSSMSDETRNMYEMALDTTGRDWASSLKTAWQGTWILNGAFSQVLTPRLQMGGELTWIASNGASIGALGGRYVFGKNIMTGSVSRQADFQNCLTNNTHTCKLQFVRNVTDRLAMATELEYHHPSVESSLKLGWEYAFRHARVQGLVDTGGKVSVCAQDFSGFGISGTIDYLRNDYKFGFMMHVMPSPEGNSPGSPTPPV